MAPKPVHQAKSSSETPGYKVSSLVEGPPQSLEMPAHKLSTLVEEPSQSSETPGHEVITLVEEAPQPLEMSGCMDAYELVRAAHHTSPPQRSPELCSTQRSIPKQASDSKSPKPWCDSKSGLECRSASSEYATSDQPPHDLWEDLVQVLWRWRPEPANTLC